MEFQEMKSGRRQPAAEEVFTYPTDRNWDSQPADYQRRPWYNPKAWSKKIWIGVVVLVIILIIVIAVPIGVTQSQNNAYPNYAEVAYSLAETCKMDMTALEISHPGTHY